MNEAKKEVFGKEVNVLGTQKQKVRKSLISDIYLRSQAR